MSIAALSSGGFSQFVTSASNIDVSQQALQALQQALQSGNLNAAQAAFHVYQALTQNLASSPASSTSTNSQFAADLAALGKAIAAGDLATSRSAFATIAADAKATNSPAIAAALAAAVQTVAEIEDLLSIFNTNNTAPAATDPTTALLESKYGATPASVNGGSIASPGTVNLYA